MYDKVERGLKLEIVRPNFFNLTFETLPGYFRRNILERPCKSVAFVYEQRLMMMMMMMMMIMMMKSMLR